MSPAVSFFEVEFLNVCLALVCVLYVYVLHRPFLPRNHEDPPTFSFWRQCSNTERGQ